MEGLREGRWRLREGGGGLRGGESQRRRGRLRENSCCAALTGACKHPGILVKHSFCFSGSGMG